MLLIDLDGFKAINDTHGHAAGDFVLQTVARWLDSHVRPGDTVARMGGDEFAVLMPQAGSDIGIARAAELDRQLNKLAARWGGRPSGFHRFPYPSAGGTPDRRSRRRG